MTQSEGHECPEGMFPGSHVHKLLVFRASGDGQDAKMSLRGWKSSRIPRQVSLHRSGLRIERPRQGQAGRDVGGNQCVGRDEEKVARYSGPYLGSVPS